MHNEESRVGLDVPTVSAKPQPIEVLARAVARKARITFAFAIGFYLYALLICAALVVGGWLVAAYVRSACLLAVLLFFCFGGSALIVVSLIPRPHRFVRSGQQIDPTGQPGLRRVITGLSGALGQPAPTEIYLDSRVNAQATERGGIFGARKHRVLVFGLPLFPLLSVAQFRAVAAHELAHFYWGDTRLGPWLNRTGEAIEHTVNGLHIGRWTAWLNLLFFWYGDLFLDMVHDLSRQQEFLADQLAAQIAGATHQIEALQLIHVAEGAYAAYWSGTVVPLVASGVRPPVLEGFGRFLRSTRVSGSVLRQVDTRMRGDKTQDYDRHPALPERVSAVSTSPSQDLQREDHSALTLISDVEQLETGLLAEAFGKETVSTLRRVSWEDMSKQAYLPMWEKTVRTYSKGLERLTPDGLPDIIKKLSVFGEDMLKRSNRPADLDSVSRITGNAIGAALAVALHQAGWELKTSPGVPVTAERGDACIEPFEVIGKLAASKLTAGEWRRQCTEAGIAGVDFGKLLSR